MHIEWLAASNIQRLDGQPPDMMVLPLSSHAIAIHLNSMKLGN